MASSNPACLEVEMQTNSLALSRPSGQAASSNRPLQCRTQSPIGSDALVAGESTSAESRGPAAGSPSIGPSCPAWWILHRLASPQPFPTVGLPNGASRLVGDRTWRRCRQAVQP